MGELINGRTPEEIKRGCKTCGALFECRGDCPYYDVEHECMKQMSEDVLAYIERLEAAQPKWISVKDHKPAPFVSVQVYMTDAGDFPPVREGYLIDDTHFYIPAIQGIHPVSHWTELATPPEEDA